MAGERLISGSHACHIGQRRLSRTRSTEGEEGRRIALGGALATLGLWLVGPVWLMLATCPSAQGASEADAQSARRGKTAIAVLWLEDGTHLAPGMVVRDESPRRVVWGFPLGLFFAVTTCRHIETRRDAEWLSWPIMAYLDVLRGVLRECLRWCRPEASLARKHFWPIVDGERPTGVCVTTHDLCGYSEEGVRFIRETCDALDSPTVFFDMPPIRMAAGEAGDLGQGDL